MSMVLIDNKCFSSIGELCEEYGLVTKELYAYKNKWGISLQEAVDVKLGRGIIVNGEKFDNHKCACKHFSVPITEVQNLMRSTKKSLEEILDADLIKGSVKGMIKVKGKSFYSKKDACEYFGIKENTVYVASDRKGISFEESLERLIDRKDEKIVVNGLEFDSIAQVGKHYDLTSGYISSIMNDTGKDVETVVNELLSRVIKIDGVQYSSMKDACDKNGININSVRTKMYKEGISFEESFKHYKDLQIKIGDEVYSNMLEACRALGLNYITVMSYKNANNVSFNEAIEHYLNR